MSGSANRPPRPDGRQTDIELGWFDEADCLEACILIESKVTADFQPGQAEAYSREIARHRETLGATRACSVLIAPRAKLYTLEHDGHFDAAIAIEDVIAALEARRSDGISDAEIDARLAVRVQLLEALCGKRQAASWTQVTIASKRDFATAYADLARTVVPHLTVRPSTDGPKALTRTFDGLSQTPTFPTEVKLKHEFGSGVAVKYANLQFTGAAPRLANIAAATDLLVGTPYHLRAGGTSLFVQVQTPGLDPAADRFESQREKVLEGLHAVDGLSRWFETHRSRLVSLLGDPGPPTDESLSSGVPSAVFVPLTRAEQEKALDRALRDLVMRSISDFDYTPNDFIRMLGRIGAVATARTLLAGDPSRGFNALWERGGLSVTLEALVIQEPWRSSILFDDDEITRAERRLKAVHYTGARS